MTFHASYDAMEQTAGVLESGAEDIKGQLHSLLGKVEELLGEGFKTDLASGKFGEGYNELNNGVNTAVAGITDMAIALRSMSQKTREHDASMAGS
ncbi:WXG100 family type VII secretion target [Cryobacterium sp. TMT2-23]|uniref:WXG100 family type VII secretion target n=1 Tax=Cryobacterium sp. TMT2-23 TaxID=1259252 RepID=UPI001F53F2FE|nr:WXG100 family type VII secretion target [Cryobacterium sp. TMT2-23]